MCAQCHDFFDVADNCIRLQIRQRQISVVTVIDRDNSTTCCVSRTDVGTRIANA